jgi:hypothetical protein
MIVTIDDPTFRHVDYDAAADALRIYKDDPSTAVGFDTTPEGHVLWFNAAGELVGVTLIRSRRFLDRDGKLEVVLPLTSTPTSARLTKHSQPPSLPLELPLAIQT